MEAKKKMAKGKSCRTVRTPSGMRCLCTGKGGGFAKMSRCR